MTVPEYKKFFSLVAVVAVALSVSSCTLIRDVTGEERPLGLSPTGLGAASGAVVGAGVGAIIGSQSGNAGPGIAIGTLAGAALGGALGQQEEREKNSHEERNSRTDRQDELLKANERRINEYKKGVDISAERRGALSNPNFASKKVSSSSSSIVNAPPGYRGNPRAVGFSDSDALPSTRAIRPAVNAAIEPRVVTSRTATATTALKSSIPTENRTSSKVISKTNQLDLIQEIEPVKPTVVQPVAKLEQRGLPQAKTPEPLLIQKEADETIKSEITKAASTGGIVGVPVDQNQTSTEEIKTTVITGSKVGKSGQDDDCSRADQEYQRANTSISDADKLFYLRRALRLCSSKANFHLATGKVYAKLGRTEDAEYEFRQVLDLESNNAEATKELASLKQGTR